MPFLQSSPHAYARRWVPYLSSKEPAIESHVYISSLGMSRKVNPAVREAHAGTGNDMAEAMPAPHFLLTPYRFRLPRTKHIIFGKIMQEISEYGMTESYYRTLDYATKLRKELVKTIDHFAAIQEVPPPKDNLRELDEVACRLYASSAQVLEAVEAYLPTLFLLAKLEKDNHIKFRQHACVEWSTAFPFCQDDIANVVFKKGYSINYELCHVIFLQGIAEYTKASRGLYKLRMTKSSTTAAKTWQYLRVAAGTLFHVCINSAHDHNNYSGKDHLNPEMIAGVLNLLAALVIAQTQHVVYVRAVSSGATLHALERVCLDLVRAYGRVGDTLGALIIGDNEEMKALMVANDWYVALVKLIYLKNGILLRASKRQFLQAEVWANVGLGICRARGHTTVHVMEVHHRAFSKFMKAERKIFQDFVDEFKQITSDLQIPRGPAAHIRTQLMDELSSKEKKISLASLSSSVSSMVPYQEHIVEDHEINDYVDFFSGPRASRRIAYDKKLAEHGGLDTDNEEDDEITKDGMAISSRSSAHMGISKKKYHKWSTTQNGKTEMMFERIRTSEELGKANQFPTNKELKESIEARKNSLQEEELQELLDNDINRKRAGLTRTRYECGLCCQEFASLEGSVTFKSIQSLRYKWGMEVDVRKRANTATILYSKTGVCSFCLQFFYPVVKSPASGGSKYAAEGYSSGKTSAEKEKDAYGKYVLSESFKVPKTTESISVQKSQASSITSSVSSHLDSSLMMNPNREVTSKGLIVPCNASFIQLDRSNRNIVSNKDLPHYHSPAYPLQDLQRSGIIPSAAIASHGWGIDGKVDDLFYKAALGYDDNALFSSMQSLLEDYFTKNGEIDGLHAYFSHLLSVRLQSEGENMLHPDSIYLSTIINMFDRKDPRLIAAAKDSRHLNSIAEAGALRLLRQLEDEDRVKYVNWTQFLTILKTVVTPCSICRPHEKACQTFKFRPSSHGPDYCACGHSLQKHVNPTLSLETNVLAREDDLSSPSYQRLPSTWISPARKKKKKKVALSDDEVNAQILDETLTQGRTITGMKLHRKHIFAAEVQYKKLLPIIEDATSMYQREKSKIPTNGKRRRQMLSKSLKQHIDEKIQRETPELQRLSDPSNGKSKGSGVDDGSKVEKSKVKIQKIKIMCGLCRQYFSLDNLQCLATRGRLLEIREEFKKRGERRKRATFLKGKHVYVDIKCTPIESETIISERYGRVTKSNVQLEQVHVVHLDGARAWYRVKDSLNWKIEDSSGYNFTEDSLAGRDSSTKKDRSSNIYDLKPAAVERIKFFKNRSKQLKKYDKVRICVFCAQLYDHAFETNIKEQKEEEALMSAKVRKARNRVGKDGMDKLLQFKLEMRAKKLKLEEEEKEAERIKAEKIEAERFQKNVERKRREAMKEQHETDAGTEHQLTAGERRHAQIKKWENDNDLKYFELPIAERRKLDKQFDQDETFRISKEADDLNILLDKIGLNLTTIPFSLAQLRAMSLQRRLRTIAAIRIQSLARGFIDRIRIVRRLGGDAASLEQGIDEIREKIEEVRRAKLRLEQARMEREKKRVEARLMDEKRQRELKAKKRRREMLEQYELKHK